MQRLSTTMMCRFLRLFMVRIFLKAFGQAKRAALKGTFTYYLY
jgi:hypothetical protein